MILMMMRLRGGGLEEEEEDVQKSVLGTAEVLGVQQSRRSYVYVINPLFTL